MLEPRRVLTFREVAHRRSFSRAAEALALTQPAVSQHVRALETQLGTRLIRRGAGGFALTWAGEVLLEHADAVAERLLLAEQQLGEETGRLRVGAFASALASIVPAAIAQLKSVEVGLVEAGADAVAAGVRSGRLHVGLCFQDSADPRREDEGTRRHELWEEPMLIGVARTHRLAGRTRVRLADLADEPWVASTRDGLIARACNDAGFEPRIEYLTADPLAIAAFISGGHAVSLVPRILAPHLPGVATVAVAGTPVRRCIYALMPNGRVHALVPEFLAALLDATN